jgi:hypothetical protein
LVHDVHAGTWNFTAICEPIMLHAVPAGCHMPCGPTEWGCVVYLGERN